MGSHLSFLQKKKKKKKERKREKACTWFCSRPPHKRCRPPAVPRRCLWSSAPASGRAPQPLWVETHTNTNTDARKFTSARTSTLHAGQTKNTPTQTHTDTHTAWALLHWWQLQTQVSLYILLPSCPLCCLLNNSCSIMSFLGLTVLYYSHTVLLQHTSNSTSS